LNIVVATGKDELFGKLIKQGSELMKTCFSIFVREHHSLRVESVEAVQELLKKVRLLIVSGR
jgi:hypothetical protein